MEDKEFISDIVFYKNLDKNKLIDMLDKKDELYFNLQQDLDNLKIENEKLKGKLDTIKQINNSIDILDIINED